MCVEAVGERRAEPEFGSDSGIQLGWMDDRAVAEEVYLFGVETVEGTAEIDEQVGVDAA